MTTNLKRPKIGRKILFIIFIVLISGNLYIYFSGKTYIYKGVKETYLRGVMGPTIYDSIIFPVRVAQQNEQTDLWKVADPQIELEKKEIEYLNSIETTSFLVIKDNQILVEKYFGSHNASTKSNSFSMAKSVMGLLIGIAVEEGKIKSFDDPISQYLPFSIQGDNGVTVRDLLGMSSGIKWRESGSNPFSENAEAYYTNELVAMMEKSKFIKEPGKEFEYRSGNSELLGIILKEATGKSPTEYFEHKVWQKLGAKDDAYWSLDQQRGMEKTFCCLYATTRDYARLGQLILNKGKWKGNQIVSEKMMKELTTPYNDEFSFYGLHYWIFQHPQHPAVYYRGILGQYIIAIPSLDVVLVRTGQKREKKFVEADENSKSYKDQHPKDLFKYFEIAERIAKKYEKTSEIKQKIKSTKKENAHANTVGFIL